MSLSIATFECRRSSIDELSAELWERGTLGIQETELPGSVYRIEAYFDEPFEAGAISGFTGWRDVAEPATEESWKQAWHPVSVGEKLWLAPSWNTEVQPTGRLRVAIHPGQGSGTSFSEPTLLMLEALEKELRPGDTVVDVGTGSGILTAAAHALGAHRLLGCDVEATSAAEAGQHLTEEGISAQIWCGSPRSLASGIATLVLANINALQLEALAPELDRILAPEGRLLLGGFTDRSLARIETAFGRPIQRAYQRGIWRALALGTRKTVQAPAPPTAEPAPPKKVSRCPVHN